MNSGLENSLFGAGFGVEIESKTYVIFIVFGIHESKLDQIEPNNFSKAHFSSRYCLFGDLKSHGFHKQRGMYKHFAAFNADNLQPKEA